MEVKVIFKLSAIVPGNHFFLRLPPHIETKFSYFLLIHFAFTIIGLHVLKIKISFIPGFTVVPFNKIG